MGSPLYNFLTESFLLDSEHIEDGYDKFSDDELRQELDRYRDHALSEAPVPSDFEQLDLRVSAGTNTVSLDKLKQGALYVEQVVVDDPLFRLTHRQSEIARVSSQALGFEKDPDRVDRRRLVAAASYLKEITPMVASDYVVPIPVSVLFEPPAEIPLYAPADRNKSAVPEGIREWFWDRVQLSSLERTEDGWIDVGEFNIGRGLRVSFEGAGRDGDFIYHLQEAEVVDYDDEEDVARFAMRIPDHPPQEKEFYAWVEQSVNGSAYELIKRFHTEAAFSYDLNSSYLSPNPFAFELLQQTIGEDSNIPTHTANSVLQFDLPLVNADAETLMKIRDKEGEAFQNFRLKLEELFRELREIDDPNEAEKRKENLAHEISEVQVRDVQQKVSSIKKKLPYEVAGIAISLASGIATGGLSTVAGLAALGAAAKAGLTAQNYRTEVAQHPAYFLWRVKNESDTT